MWEERRVFKALVLVKITIDYPTPGITDLEVFGFCWANGGAKALDHTLVRISVLYTLVNHIAKPDHRMTEAPSERCRIFGQGVGSLCSHYEK